MANPYYIDPLGGFNAGQAAANIGSALMQRKERESQNALMSQAADVFRSGNAQAMADFMIQNPQMRDSLIQAQGFKDATTMKARMDGVKRILSGEDHVSVANQTADAIRAAGGNPSDTLAMIDRSPEEAKTIALQQLALMNPQAALAYGKATGQGAGFLTANQRDAESRAKALVGTLNPDTNAPYTIDDARAAVARYSVGITPKAGSLSAQERIAALGTTESIAESQKKIKSAEARGEGAGKIAVSTIDKAFTSITKAESNIRNIDRAISALDRGANTGAIERYLPSVKAATKELEQIRNELGLDVVGSVTFGALSESELDLALQTGLPDGLDSAELRDWLIRKRDAQKKLIGYFDEQIAFLENGGTLGEWRSKVSETEGSTEGGSIDQNVVDWGSL